MKAGLRSLLLSQSSVTAIVGAAGAYVQHAAQGVSLPYVVIHQEQADNNNTLDSTSGSFRALDFEIDCKGRTAAESESLRETVHDLLKDYAGAAGAQLIDAVIVNDEFDSVEKPFDGSDNKTFVVTLDITIQYHPA